MGQKGVGGRGKGVAMVTGLTGYLGVTLSQQKAPQHCKKKTRYGWLGNPDENSMCGGFHLCTLHPSPQLPPASVSCRSAIN